MRRPQTSPRDHAAGTFPMPLSKHVHSPFHHFDLEAWSRLRRDTPMSLGEDDLARLRGINEKASVDEVERVYLPLSRLLSLYVAAAQALFRRTAEFLGSGTGKVPYIIGLAGSVAVGKSTTARILQALLARWPNHPKVDLITTDGFLLPNRELIARDLMPRKGFPESYDRGALLAFLSDIKGGRRHVTAPVYSHLVYDIVPGERIEIDQPDILIVEGLNVLQTGRPDAGEPRLFVSDFFDVSIYLDADEAIIRDWYIDRFLALRAGAFSDPRSYFHRYAGLNDAEAVEVADGIWNRTNLTNLRENILPTRQRADVILRKAADHAIHEVFLRKI